MKIILTLTMAGLTAAAVSEGATLWTTKLQVSGGTSLANASATQTEGDALSPSVSIDAVTKLKDGSDVGFKPNVFVPDTNVISASGWKAAFTCTNLDPEIDTIDSITFDVYTRTSGNGTQVYSKNAVLTLEVFDGSDWTTYLVDGKTGDEHITIRGNTTPNNTDSFTFSGLNLTNLDQLQFRLNVDKPSTGDATFIGLAGFSVNGQMAPSNIPEPVTASLSLLGLSALLWKRRKR